jgi:hypothetical protein
MRATIMDIASKAGVSKTTVSFAFNCPDRISRDTYERVMRVANELGYIPTRSPAFWRAGGLAPWASSFLVHRRLPPRSARRRDPSRHRIRLPREELTLEILESAPAGWTTRYGTPPVDGSSPSEWRGLGIVGAPT